MFGAYPFAGGYYGQGPALTPVIVAPTIVNAPMQVAHLTKQAPEADQLTARQDRAGNLRKRGPSVTNWEQH